MEINKIILWIIIIVILILLVFSTFGFNLYGMFNASKDKSSSGMDKCKPAPGYTEESWKEHMSHHPDIYKGCL